MEPMTMLALAQMGSGLGQMLFGGDNPSDSAMQYFPQMKDTLEKYLSPYMDAGQRALPGLEKHFGSLMDSPGGRLNEIGAGFQKSPGFDFALKQALQAGNNASAAGGMAGTPQHQYQAMQTATGFANQDFNNWLNHALGLYGTGLMGNQNIYGVGAQAGIGLGEDLAGMLSQQSGLAYKGQDYSNTRRGNSMSSIFGGLGSLFGGGGGFGGFGGNKGSSSGQPTNWNVFS